MPALPQHASSTPLRPSTPARRATGHPASKHGARRLLASACLALATTWLGAPVLAAEPTALASAMALLQKASAGDAGAVTAGATQWRALLATEPQNPVLRVYAGAMTSMQATTTLLPWKKLAFADEGLAMIDKALAQLGPAHTVAGPSGVPAALEVRFTAANTFLALPSLFNRGARGAQLLQQVLADPALGSSPAPFQAAVRSLATRHPQAVHAAPLGNSHQAATSTAAKAP